MYADFFEGEKCYLRRIVKRARKMDLKTAELSLTMLTHLLWAFEDLISADRYHQKRMEELYEDIENQKAVISAERKDDEQIH
jgi:hypothetical protein